MRVISERELTMVLGALTGTPRVVAGGNYATPWRALSVLDGTVPRYRLFVLNAQPGIPDRDGVTLESPFVGPGMRGHGRLRYFPCRLSLVPALLTTALPPDVVLVRTLRDRGISAAAGAGAAASDRGLRRHRRPGSAADRRWRHAAARHRRGP